MDCPECHKPMSPYTDPETGHITWCCPECGVERADRITRVWIALFAIMTLVGLLCLIFVPVHAQRAEPLLNPFITRFDRYGVEVRWIINDPNLAGTEGVAKIRYPDGVSWMGLLLSWCGWVRDPGMPNMARWCNTGQFPLFGTGLYTVFDGNVAGVPIGFLPQSRYLWQYQLAAPAVMK